MLRQRKNRKNAIDKLVISQELEEVFDNGANDDKIEMDEVDDDTSLSLSLDSKDNDGVCCEDNSDRPPRLRCMSSSSLSSESLRSSMGGVRRANSKVFLDTTLELKQLKSQVSVWTLLQDEIQRLGHKRSLVFPEAPSRWDRFWIGLLGVFVLSIIPGLFRFGAWRFPGHWKPTGETLRLNDNINATLQLYTTAGYGIVTPLSKPMPSYFFFHVMMGGMASLLLLVLFATGRVMRWRLTNGTVKYDSAENLHKLAALASLVCWPVIIVSGAITVPILHPILQVANYAECAGVLTLFVGTLLSAYFRQWIVHRLMAWGLIYSAVASIFVGISGRCLQAWSGWTAFEIKALGYTVAFLTPIFGLLRDLWCEAAKVHQQGYYEEMLARAAKQSHCELTDMHEVPSVPCPFQAARSIKLRRLSLCNHLKQAEPLAEHQTRRHSSIYTATTCSIRSWDSDTSSTTSDDVSLACGRGGIAEDDRQELLKLFGDSDSEDSCDECE